MTITEADFSIPTDDSHVIHGVTWSSMGAPKAQVLIAHGRSEHARRYRPAAQAMAAAGYRVHAIDHRGHGASALQGGSLGDFGPRGFDAVVDDLAVACRAIRGQGAELPLLLFAHSMGSFAAQYFVLDHSALVDGIVLSGTAAVDLRDPRRAGALAADFNAGIADPRTAYDWLSRDAAVVDAYLADPLCGFMLTPEATASIYAHAHRTAEPQAYRDVRRSLPLALITGDRDPVNLFLEWFDPLARRLREFGFTDVSTYVYGGARHEPLNELNRGEVLANLIAWLDRVSAGAGSTRR